MGAGELGDVSGGDVIAAGFTNNVKDRTIMRYASAASRDAIITAPVAGSLSYLDNTSQVEIYTGSFWAKMQRVDANGNINLNGDDFVTVAPGEFRGPGNFDGGQFINATLFEGPGSIRKFSKVAGSIPGFAGGAENLFQSTAIPAGFIDVAKIGISIVGNASNPVTLRASFSYSDFDLGAGFVFVRAWVDADMTTPGTAFFDMYLTEHW